MNCRFFFSDFESQIWVKIKTKFLTAPIASFFEEILVMRCDDCHHANHGQWWTTYSHLPPGAVHRSAPASSVSGGWWWGKTRMLRCPTVSDRRSSGSSFLSLGVPGTPPYSGRMDLGRCRRCGRRIWDGQADLWLFLVLWVLCLKWWKEYVFQCVSANTSVLYSDCFRDTTSQTKLCTFVLLLLLLHPDKQMDTSAEEHVL